ncbi:calcineurin-like phosphoesterase C-terminal domain-containing protein [Arenibacter certesii]|uniref:Serine/threonine protein phosphatase n=1 Tax=Arenibacter certesii TaxID=228955 RepID=A0A918MIC6_9FLAO|nr:calcineurin-like phosphoesterase C-terminal domain-containing protein [Arenibacter certesii]GGW24788.1 serine/threonine protein phosphatase [Arenibacter certesii]
MNQTRRKFIKIGGLSTIAGLSGIGLVFSSCDNKESIDFDDNNNLNITGVSIPPSLNVKQGGTITLTGKGFNMGDKIKLTSTLDTGLSFNNDVTSVGDGTVTFSVPNGLTTGNYKINVERGAEELILGAVLLNLMANTEIPDIEGMTVKGVVYSEGKGIPGVVVSDGYEVTVTDEEGVYYLPSLKKIGFVFISIPGNYEVTNEGKAPQFFKRLSNNSTAIEQKDFSLIKTNNDKHVVIPMADWHLANRNNDIDQFTGTVLPDVNTAIDQYSADGTKVYVLTLGDMTWDTYWYNNDFGLNEYIPYMNMLNCPVFNVIGNHDYDPYYANDWEAENKYRDVLGPTYYSFNLGKVHYVVLDDVEYINTGGAIGTVGDRNYKTNISPEQIEWLKKDLAAITDKSTPIVIAMHTPLYRRPTLDAYGDQVNNHALDNGSTLINCLKDFSTVHVLSGHTHVNYRIEEEENIMEHNTAAICATWWWTGRNGYAGNHICKDGSPGGYGIWQMNGKDVQWRYKSIGYEEDYQFRSYDLNQVHITASEFAPNTTEETLAPYAGPYTQKNVNNEVLINIWGYDSQWEIEVTENNNKLNVTRVNTKDPLHIISYDALRLNVGATPTGAFVTNDTAHLFKVTASAPSTTLEIKVTDRFGNVYTENMVRPKAFSLNMS